MEILEFPSDILVVLGKCLPLRDLNSLLQANRHLALLLNTVLYQRAIKLDGGSSLMDWGVRHGNESLISTLVNKYKVSASVRDELSEDTPLHIAAYEGQDGIAQLLLELGAPVDARNGNSETPLHVSARRGKVEVCKVLLDNNADVNATTDMGAAKQRAKLERELARLRELGSGPGPIFHGPMSDARAQELWRILNGHLT